MIHEMKLQPEPFNKIAESKKIIEIRLFDDKRQLINLGDSITFKKESELEEYITVSVEGLLRYRSFRNLISDLPVEYFGEKDKEVLFNNVYKYYTQEQEEQYGVLGIKIKLT